MIPVHQTILPSADNPLKGNYFAACLASLLELPLAEVPHLMEHPDWRERTNAWLATRGLGYVEVWLDTSEPALFGLPEGLAVLVIGKTSRHSERLHAVVARTIGPGHWEYLHDPHPDGGYLTEAKALGVLVPLNPAIGKE